MRVLDGAARTFNLRLKLGLDRRRLAHKPLQLSAIQMVEISREDGLRLVFSTPENRRSLSPHLPHLLVCLLLSMRRCLRECLRRRSYHYSSASEVGAPGVNRPCFVDRGAAGVHDRGGCRRG